MGAGNGHNRLTGMSGLSADRMEHKRSTGDGFVMLVGIGQAHEERPPVVNQRHQSADDPATLQILVVKPPQPHSIFSSWKQFLLLSRTR